MLLRCAFFTVCFACSAFAADDIASVVQDPHLLAEYINTHPDVDLAPLRTALGVDTSTVFLPPCEAGECHAEVIDVAGTIPAQAILWASHKSSGFAFWLRYRKNSAGAWSFWAAVAVNVKYFTPEHRLATVFGRPFFVVVEQGMAGTGLSKKIESWFDLSLSQSRSVFAFTPEGDRMGYRPSLVHTVEASATAVRQSAVEQFRVDYTADYHADAEDDSQGVLRIARLHTTATYVRQTDGTFRFDQKPSAATKQMIDDVFDIQDDDGITNEAFLKFDMTNLRHIAANPKSPEAKWLAEFLKTCKPSPQKTELLRLLH